MLTLPHLQRNVRLAPLTTYQIGGPADLFVEANTKEELVAAILGAHKEGLPFFVLGTGANILIGDKGVRGLVIHNRAKGFAFEGDTLVAESGAEIADLITAAADRGLSGIEHYAGIPSSVGGALRQNLHFLSPDRTTTLYIGDIVERALVLENDEIQTVDHDYFAFGYDDSIINHQPVFVLEASFRLTPGDKKSIEAQIQANLAWRREKQPQLEEFPSCGSVFKKIEGVGAGRLIDAAGLKGVRAGGAMISPQHANFIVNTGGATADNVLELIHLVQEKVEETSGYRLETEIGFVGEF